jgi:hypothetical protein
MTTKAPTVLGNQIVSPLRNNNLLSTKKAAVMSIPKDKSPHNFISDEVQEEVLMTSSRSSKGNSPLKRTAQEASLDSPSMSMSIESCNTNTNNSNTKKQKTVLLEGIAAAEASPPSAPAGMVPCSWNPHFINHDHLSPFMLPDMSVDVDMAINMPGMATVPPPLPFPMAPSKSIVHNDLHIERPKNKKNE